MCVRSAPYFWYLDESNVPAYIVEITNDENKAEGGLMDLSNLQITFNKRYNSASLGTTKGVCKSDEVCLCQRSVEDPLETFQLGRYQYDALYPQNARLEHSNLKTLTKGTYSLHEFGKCTKNEVTLDYYSEEECNHIGGTFQAEQTVDIQSHFDVVATDVLSQETNPIETKNLTHIIDIYGSSTWAFDNVVSYSRSMNREFVGNEVLLEDRNRVTIDCLQRCRKNEECTFASLSSQGQCILHRKCERTKNDLTFKNNELILDDGVDTYRKVGIHSKKESTAGIVKKGFYHEVAVETFLCKNFDEGKRLHNSFFDRPNSNTLLAGSSFYHLHSQSSLWPTDRYLHYDNRFWISSHPTKAFLKYDAENEAYIAFLRSEDDPSKAGLQFGYVQTSDCLYSLPKDSCLDYANSQLLSVGNMDLAGIQEYYLVAEFDDECVMGSLTEDQCNQYRTANDFLGIQIRNQVVAV